VKHSTEAILKHFRQNEEMIGFELRATTLGHVVRGAQPMASDRILATRLGVAAVEALAQGARGVLVGISRGEVSHTPLSEVAGRTKTIDLALMDLAKVLAK
jgi:6-phosphofructokinase 1